MKKVLAIVVAFALIAISIGLWGGKPNNPTYVNSAAYLPHLEFETKYTKEEHIARITERTKEIFKRDILVNIKVEIIYAFHDNDPEYFLVEVEHSTPFSSQYLSSRYKYKTKYQHVVGQIRNDEYIYGHTFREGRNPWSFLGYDNAKKYFSGGSHQEVYAIETLGGMLKIYEVRRHVYPIGYDKEEDFSQEFLSKTEQEKLMTSNYQIMITTEYKATW